MSRWGNIPIIFVAMTIVLTTSTTAAAAPAPHLHWRTLKTACCDIHYPQAQADVGARVAAIADDAVDNAVTLMRSPPADRIQIVLHDVTDSPNGFANVVPYDRVELRMITPEADSELAKSDDWLRLLVQHELLHIIHLDVIHGLPAIINLVIGKSWPPNVVQPRMFVEGLAVYAETRFTSGGRLRSSLFKAPLRVAALRGDRWSLDDASNASRRPPGGVGAYLYGSFFIEHLAKKYGTQFLAAWAHDYGGTFIPYGVQRSIEGITGRDLVVDWNEFLDELLAEARADEAVVIARGGPTTTRRLTRLGGTIKRPVFRADGTLIFGAAPPDGPPGIYALRGLPGAVPVPEPIIRTTEAADVAVVDDEIVFAQTEVHERWSSFRDLFVLDVDGRVRQLTFGARVQQPLHWPHSPFGDRVVVAEHRTGSVSSVVAVDIDSGVVVDVVTAAVGETFYTPVPSPDGRTIAVSRLDADGRRRIALFDVVTKQWQAFDDADVAHGDQLDPSWSSAHELLYVEDTDGIFDVVSVDIDSGARRRIVDTLGGAAKPVISPDGNAVIFTDLHLDGVDLYVAATTSSPGASLPPTPLQPLDVAFPTAPPSSFVDEPYSVLPTLLPRTWSGTVSAGDPLGFGASLALDGRDAAQLIDWSLRLGLSTTLLTPAVAATVRFTNLTLPTTFNLELRPTLADRGRTNDGVVELQREDQVRASVTTSIPFRRRRFSHAIGLGSQRVVSFDHLGVTSSPDSLTPTYPDTVKNPQQTIFTLDWSYSGLETYRDSVSPERGFASFVRLRLADRLVFSDTSLRELVVDARAFQPLPGLGNHVVAALLSGAASLDDRPGSAWALGGFVDRSLLNDALDNNRTGGGALRGFPLGHVVGDVLTALTVEYRFPVFELERGLETLPLFVDRLHGAIFVDGAAAVGARDASQLRFATGVGVEVRLQMVIGYYGSLLVRLGYARGLTPGGVDQPYAILGVPY